ncbi:MAG: hypothetical protein M3483_08705, partial [Gemmatimonadota bacterium]|nr:hypothetical protein [Gemmatimonadota bacterium]
GAPGALQRGQPSSTPQAAGSMQGWSIVLFLVAVVLIASGLGVGEFGMVMAGAGAGAGGALLHLSARRNREVRRQALISSLQLPVLQLAAEREGRLTVSQVAASLGWSLPRAEKVLNSLEDGLRISSEVTDEGVIVYEFRELAHAPQRHLDLRELS